jgi:hypothetical protein
MKPSLHTVLFFLLKKASQIGLALKGLKADKMIMASEPKVANLLARLPVRVKIVFLLASLGCLAAAAILVWCVRSAPSSMALIFSGFTNDGQVAVFTLTNSSRLHPAEIWLATTWTKLGEPHPNFLGDSQVKGAGGAWIGCYETVRYSGVKPLKSTDGLWLYPDHGTYYHYEVRGVHADTLRTIRPGGSLLVLMPVPALIGTVKIKNSEQEVGIHAPWRAGIRCLVNYEWPKPIEAFLPRFRTPERHSLRYPDNTFKVWSAELPR